MVKAIEYMWKCVVGVGNGSTQPKTELLNCLVGLAVRLASVQAQVFQIELSLARLERTKRFWA